MDATLTCLGTGSTKPNFAALFSCFHFVGNCPVGAWRIKHNSAGYQLNQPEMCTCGPFQCISGIPVPLYLFTMRVIIQTQIRILKLWSTSPPQYKSQNLGKGRLLDVGRDSRHVILNEQLFVCVVPYLFYLHGSAVCVYVQLPCKFLSNTACALMQLCQQLLFQQLITKCVRDWT